MGHARGGDDSQLRVNSAPIRAGPLPYTPWEGDRASVVSMKLSDDSMAARPRRHQRRYDSRTTPATAYPISAPATSVPMPYADAIQPKEVRRRRQDVSRISGEDKSRFTEKQSRRSNLTRSESTGTSRSSTSIRKSRKHATVPRVPSPAPLFPPGISKARENYLRFKKFLKMPGSFHGIFGVIQFSMAAAMDRMPAHKANAGQPNSDLALDLAHLKGFIGDFRNFLALGDLFAIGKAAKAHFKARHTTTDDKMTRAVGYLQHIANAGYSAFEGPSILAYRGIFRMSRTNEKNERRKYLFVRASCWFWALAIFMQFFEIGMESIADRRVRRKIRDRDGRLDELTKKTHDLKRRRRQRRIIANSIWAPLAIAWSMPVNPLPMPLVNILNAAGKGVEVYSKWKATKEP